MSPGISTLVLISMAGLLIVCFRWALRTGAWRMFYAFILGLAAFALCLNWLFGFPTTRVTSMGLREDLPLWGALYLCMIMGMLSQYAYRHFDRPVRKRTQWDWGLFAAPVFASPLVFIPLASSLAGAGLNLGSMSGPKFMVFLVAFQNGFFWKEYFDLKQKEATEPG